MRLPRLFDASNGPHPTDPSSGAGQDPPKSSSTDDTNYPGSLEKEALAKEIDHVQGPVTPTRDENVDETEPREANGESEKAKEVVEESNGSSSPEKSAEVQENTTSASPAEEEVDEAGVDDESKYLKSLPLALLTFGLALTTASPPKSYEF
jgi:hypothetical protein